MMERDSNTSHHTGHRDGRHTASTADLAGTAESVDPAPANAAERAGTARAPFSDPMPTVEGEHAPSERGAEEG